MTPRFLHYLNLPGSAKLSIECPSFLEKWKNEIEDATGSGIKFGKVSQEKEVSIENKKAKFEFRG